jgi:hypothetical protein
LSEEMDAACKGSHGDEDGEHRAPAKSSAAPSHSVCLLAAD